MGKTLRRNLPVAMAWILVVLFAHVLSVSSLMEDNTAASFVQLQSESMSQSEASSLLALQTELQADPAKADKMIQRCLSNYDQYTELLWQDFVARNGFSGTQQAATAQMKMDTDWNAHFVNYFGGLNAVQIPEV